MTRHALTCPRAGCLDSPLSALECVCILGFKKHAALGADPQGRNLQQLPAQGNHDWGEVRQWVEKQLALPASAGGATFESSGSAFLGPPTSLEASLHAWSPVCLISPTVLQSWQQLMALHGGRTQTLRMRPPENFSRAGSAGIHACLRASAAKCQCLAVVIGIAFVSELQRDTLRAFPLCLASVISADLYYYNPL